MSLSDVLVSFLDDAAAEDWCSGFFLPSLEVGPSDSCKSEGIHVNDNGTYAYPLLTKSDHMTNDCERMAESSETEPAEDEFGWIAEFIEEVDCFTSEFDVEENQSPMSTIIEQPNEDWAKPFVSRKCPSGTNDPFDMAVEKFMEVGSQISPRSKSVPHGKVYKPIRLSASPKKKSKYVKSKLFKQYNKIPVEVRLARIVDSLRRIRSPEIPPPEPSEMRYRNSMTIDLLEQTQKFLYVMMSCTSSGPTVLDLCDCMQPTATLHSSSLASFINQVKTLMSQKKKLSAHSPWMSASCSKSREFPAQHCGVGQIIGASRGSHSSRVFIYLSSHIVFTYVYILSSGFSIALHDLFSPSLHQHLEFCLEMSKSDTLQNKGRFSSSFKWKTSGLTRLGFPNEVECSGLIRCDFREKKITKASLSFDAFQIFSQASNITSNLRCDSRAIIE